MARPMLRKRVKGQHARVTTVELFFDLVFVFAVTQLSHRLLAHLTPGGAVEAIVLMLAVWWVWVFTAWITNWLDPDHPTVRAMLFLVMGVGLVLSTSLPEAFETRALPFAIAYAGIQLGRTLFTLWAVRTEHDMKLNFVRIASWLAVSAAFWIGGALAPSELRLPLWLVALAIEYAGPASAFWTPGLGRTPTAVWNVEGAHMAERCGLFTIICLGESILVTGATFAQQDTWDGFTVAAAVAAVTGAISMWWIYFNAHADAAAHAIAESDDPGRIARVAYTYAHIPIVAGIIVAAAGDELALAHPGGHTEPAAIALILGGPALFLTGGLWFKRAIFGVISRSRAIGILLLGVAAFVAPHLTPVGVSAVASAILAFVATWETIRPAHGTAHAEAAVEAKAG